MQSITHILDSVGGYSLWHLIYLPANSGRIEVAYGDSQDYWGMRRGPFKVGTMKSNIARAVLAMKEGK